MSVRLVVVGDPARVCAATMVSAAVGGGRIVLTGGSTPRAAYQEFVSVVRETGLDVSGVECWIGDERCVEPGDERANYRMIRESLLDSLPEGRRPVVHRVRGELGHEQAAREYEHELRAAGPPRFDLVLLGIGPDGHTASLFPDQPAVEERERLVVGVPEAGFEPHVPRVSFTFTALWMTPRIVLLAAGEAKADAVAAAFGRGAVADAHVPSSLIASGAQELVVLLDPAAAAKLDRPGPR